MAAAAARSERRATRGERRVPSALTSLIEARSRFFISDRLCACVTSCTATAVDDEEEDEDEERTACAEEAIVIGAQ